MAIVATNFSDDMFRSSRLSLVLVSNLLFESCKIVDSPAPLGRPDASLPQILFGGQWVTARRPSLQVIAEERETASTRPGTHDRGVSARARDHRHASANLTSCSTHAQPTSPSNYISCLPFYYKQFKWSLSSHN